MWIIVDLVIIWNENSALIDSDLDVESDNLKHAVDPRFRMQTQMSAACPIYVYYNIQLFLYLTWCDVKDGDKVP